MISPRPWEFETGEDIVIDTEGHQVWFDDDNTRHIIKAVNMHEALINAMESLIITIDLSVPLHDRRKMLIKAKELLNQAKQD